MNGYAIPAESYTYGSTGCSSKSYSATSDLSSGIPRVAPFWADLVADGTLSQTGCMPEVAGQASQLSWGAWDGGNSDIDAMVRRSSISGAASFTSTNHVVATWQNVRFAAGTTSTTCDRYTFQMVLTCDATGRTWVVMLYSRMPRTAVPSSAFTGFIGTSGGQRTWSSLSDDADSAALVLGSGSNAGLAGMYVYYVNAAQVLPAASPPLMPRESRPPSPFPPFCEQCGQEHARILCWHVWLHYCFLRPVAQHGRAAG